MDSKLWADDLNAVISGLSLEQPVVVGWSYGPLMILDYIRHYGEASVGGIQFVGGITKLGSEEATGYLTPAILALVPGLFSTNADESNKALRSLVHLFFFDEPSSDDVDLMVRYESDVPPYVRQALFSRSLDNDDVLAKLSKPLVITHSVDDRIVFPSAADQIASVVPHAQIDKLSGVGHAPFWEDAAGFNARLREFALSMSEGARDAPAGAAA
jgi:pimeloyl-ACP methyl ester carboxylesterase